MTPSRRHIAFDVRLLDRTAHVVNSTEADLALLAEDGCLLDDFDALKPNARSA